MLLNNTKFLHDANEEPSNALLLKKQQKILKINHDIYKVPINLAQNYVAESTIIYFFTPKPHSFELKICEARFLRNTLKMRPVKTTEFKKNEIPETKVSDICGYYEVFTKVKLTEKELKIAARKPKRLRIKQSKKINPNDEVFVKKYKRSNRGLLPECILVISIGWILLLIALIVTLCKSNKTGIEMLEFEDAMSLISIEVLKETDAFEAIKIEPLQFDYDAMLLEIRNKFAYETYFSREVIIVPGIQFWSRRFKRNNRDSAVFDFTEPSEQILNTANDYKYSLCSSRDPPC